MSTRREAREWALQLLFQLDVNPGEQDGAFRDFWSREKASEKARRFVEELVRGVRKNVQEIDGKIQKYTEHWDINRMGVVDRNVMRMAIYEMFFCRDIPPVVSINEAVDIAKYFSNNESGKFVNGILDRARQDLDRPGRERQTAESKNQAR